MLVDLLPPLSAAVTFTALLVEIVEAVAGKTADACALSTVTVLGTVRRVLLSEIPILVFATTDLERVTVQVAVAPEESDAGVQASEEIDTGATRLIVAVREVPFSDTVTVAVASAETVPAVAVNVAEDWPASTGAEAGTVRLALLSETATVVSALTALDRVTVQVEDAPDASDVGEHVSEDGEAVVTRLMLEVFETPLNVAVMMAEESADSVAAVAENVAEDWPLATLTEAGTLSRVGALEASATVVLAAAFFERETVHVDLAADPSVVGVQARELRTTGNASWIVALAVEPFSVAVRTAEASAVNDATVAVKVAVVWPAFTATDAGTVTAVLLLARFT
jgi:hypothetical protein